MMTKFRLGQNLYLATILVSNIFISSIAQAQPPAIDESFSGSTNPADIKDPDKVLKFSNTPERIPPTTAGLNSSVKCVAKGNSFATVAKQGDITAVLFTWKTTEFGPEYTPKSRCRIVSNKFDRLVQSNGGSFNNLYLTTAVINGYPVICTKKSDQAACNILFTLSRKNRNQADKILSSLEDPSSLGSSGIEESSSATSRQVVDLGKWSRQNLRANSTSENPPASPVLIKPSSPNTGRFKFR